jgi:predicted nucleotidyltransferase
MSKMILINEFEILKLFIKGKNIFFHGREIARRLRKNQKTISKNLLKLENENILYSEQRGKNKYYYLNFENPLLDEVIALVELNKKKNFLENNMVLFDALKELEENCQGILLVFGSYAKNTQKKDSDIDLFLIGNIKNLEYIKKSYGLNIHLIKSTKDKFDLNNNFIKEVLENHVIIKGVGEFTRLWRQ